MSEGEIIGFGALGVFIAAGVVQWRASGFDRRSATAPVTFSCHVHPKIRASAGMFVGAKTISGWMELAIRSSVVTLRAGGIRPINVVAGLDYTIDAPNFEVSIGQVGRRFGVPGRGDECVFMRGSNRRGRDLELALVPRDATVGELLEELTKAGARRVPAAA